MCPKKIRPLRRVLRPAVLASACCLLLLFGADSLRAVNNFVPTGSMAVGRSYHTATLLPNGTVLLTGGEAAPGVTLRTAEIFDPATGNVTAVGNMTRPRYGHTATLLTNGMVLIAGGLDGFVTLASAEIYNPVNGTFSPTGAMSAARENPSATLLTNGMVLIAGGYGVASAELYVPASGTFTSALNTMSTSRYFHSATLLPTGKVLIAGGFSATLGYQSTAEIFDPATSLFSATANMSSMRHGHTATLLSTGNVLLAGGYAVNTTRATAELYVPSLGTFMPTGSMTSPRYLQTATVLSNGNVLMAGGYGALEALATAEQFNPNTGVFTATGSLSAARFAATATRLNDGNVLVSGGDNSTLSLNSNELFMTAPSATSLAASAVTASYGASTTISATLISGGSAVSGRQVDFSVNGQFAGSAVTNSSGIATLAGVQFTPPLSPANYPILATFAGDAGLTGSSGGSVLTVKQAIPTIIVSGGGSFIYTAQAYAATAVATGAFGEMLGPVTVTYTNLADSSTSTSPPSLVGNYRVNASFAGNANYFAATNNSKTITIASVTSASGDVAVNVGSTRLFKLNGADGTVLWGPINRPNCGGLAVDQGDFSVYTSDAANCTGGGAGSVFKYSSAGSLTWNTPYNGCGISGNYYVGLGGIAVDTSSGTPGVVLTKTGYYGDLGKVSRSNGATLFCNGTNDLGRPTIDPGDGQIFAITNAGQNYGYNTLYSVSAAGSVTAVSSCEGFTDLNPADGMLYRGGGMQANGCGRTLSQMNKANLASPNWTMNLSAVINSFDAIAVQPWNGGYVYAASVGSGKIAVIDPATQTVVTTFSTAVAPDFIAVSPVGGHVYVASFSNRFVYAYSPTGALLWTSADLGGQITGLAAPRNLVGGQVVASTTTTSVATSANPAFSGQAVTFTAIVTATDGTATGTVTFKDGTTTIGSATLSSGTASVSTSSLAGGSHSITAIYAGALGFPSSTSPALTQIINPPPVPTAAFTATPNPAACGQTLLFDASGSHAGAGLQLASYQWNFGDNTTATGQTIAHAYSTFGVYTATLTVTDSFTPAQSATTSIVVNVNQGNRQPIANHGGPYLVDLGAAASLNGAGSSDPDAACGDSIVSYAWSINNGSITASGPSPTLTAAQLGALGAGSFPVSLTVTDEFGATNTASTTLSIYLNVPTASFTATPNPAFCSQAITFDGSLSKAGRPDRSIVAHEWDFGDGTTGIGSTTTHSYGRFGAYTARLKVTDNNVPPKTAISTVVVNVNQGNHAPVANHGGPYLVDLGSPASLNGASSTDPDIACGDSIASYAWSINSGAITAIGQSPTVSAAQLAALGTGSFPISLTVTDTFGVTSTTSTTLAIYQNVPTASFTANPNPAFCSQGITFDGSSSAAGRPDRSIVAHEWDFGDGTTGIGSTTTHSFGRFGAYTAKLKVTDSNTPAKTATTTIIVNVNQGNFAPVANAGGPYTVNYGGAVQLNAASSSEPNAGCGDQIVSYSWTIDGSVHLSGPTPTLDTSINSLSTGNHNISLTVTDTFGLSSTATTTVTVQRVLASIAVTPTPVTLFSGQQQSFTATGTFSDGSVEVLQSGGGGGPGGGPFSGPSRPEWQVQFPQRGNFSACATPQYPLTDGGGNWTSQNFFDDNGAVHETWSVGTPVVDVNGQITPSSVVLTLACTNGAASGTINAQWTGNRYEGTLFFNGATQSQVSITGWSPKASMPTARFNLTASALGSLVYAIGGTAGACTGLNPCPYFPLSTVEIYDPATDSWSTGPSLNTGREGGRAATLGGKIYVIGGHIPGGQPSGVVEVLDPSVSNAWSTLASDPMPTARANFALVSDGAYLYAIGGDNNTGALTAVERFDPSAPSGQRWTTRASLPVGGSLIGAGVLGGTIVVAGAGNSSRTDVYDIGADSWSPGVAMPAQRSAMASAAGANGGLWLIGGTTNGALNYDTWVYYPASPRRAAGWAGVGSMLTARSFAAAASVGDVIYAAGGADAANVALASHEVLSTPPFDDLSTSGSNNGGGNNPITVQWQSSNPSVAGVDSNGMASAVGIGQATIIATAGSVSCQATASCATLNVANATPVVQIFNGPVTINESSFQNFGSGGSFNDLDQQSWTATVNYGDGTGTQPLSLSNLQSGQTPTGRFNLNHAYADSGFYVVTVTVSDSQGGSGTATLPVNVNNVAPQVFGPFSASTTVGSSQQFGCVSFNDVQADSPWTATVDYGDGTGDQAVTPNAGGSCGGGGTTAGAFNLSHQYSNGGSFTVTVKVTDKDQSTGTATFSVSVNAPPVVTINNTPLAAIDEGSAFNGTASFTDAAGDGSWTVRVSYGDNTGQFTLPAMSSPGSVNLSHIYKDNGTYTVTVQVTDRLFATGTATATLIVNNVAPTVSALPTLNAIVEGQQVSFSASYSDPGLNDNQSGGFKAQINWGDGSAVQKIQNLPFNSSNGQGNFFVNHNYADNALAPQTAFAITVTVTDKDGAASASKTTQVVVNNDPPSIQLNGVPQPVDGQMVTFTGQLFDRGAFDAPWTGTVEFGDGTQQPIAFALNTPPQTPRGVFTVTHTYTQPGPVTLKLTATDKDGGSAMRSYQLNVEPVIVSVSLSPTAALLNAVGQTRLFNATALFSDGTTQSTNGAVIDEVTWTTSNPGVATIGPGGLATAVGAGVTTIRVTAQDDLAHTFTAQSTLTVDLAAPLISANDITAEATSASGASVVMTFAATDDFDSSPSVTADHASGNFPVGITTVVVTATDAAGNVATKNLKVTVHDTTPPAITAPADVTAEATGDGRASVNPGTPVVSDAVGPVTVTGGSAGPYPLGTTTITWTATDGAGNSASATQRVTVVDTINPTITAPPDITVEATGANGAAVNPGVATAADSGGPVTVTGGGSAGQYSLGTTTLTWMATDQSGNSATAIQRITVRDTTAPSITLPANITVDATMPAGAVVTYSVTATDIASSVSIACSKASGSTFPIGTTTVSCSATDAGGQVSTGSFQVMVLGAPAQVSNLLATVQQFNLDIGMTNSLSAKLQNILASLTRVPANVNSGCGQLGAFINEVRAQSGKKLTTAQADQLTTVARRVQAVVACQ